jgi:hypothetical protein
MPNPPNEVMDAYCSAATHRFHRDDVLDLLQVARTNNARLGISGILLYIDESFFQVLEGEQSVIESLYEKIERDPRHTEVTKLIQKPTHSRTFGEWSMGFAPLSREELAKLPGMNDFFKGGSTLDALRPGLARNLLEAFKGGDWRRRVVNRR